MATGREKLVDEITSTEPWSNPEQGNQDTSKLSHELPTEPRAKVEPVSGKLSVKTNFPKDPNCDICLKTKITRSSCRRRTDTVVPSADHKVLSEESESRKYHRHAWWYKTWQHTGSNHIRAKHNFSGGPEEPDEVPGAGEERKGLVKEQCAE